MKPAARRDQAPLWEAFLERGCQKARAALIEQFRPLVTLTLQRQFPHVPKAIDPEEMVSEGLIALVKAVDRFDPTRGVKFSSYAISMIWGAMAQWLRAEDWTPRSVRERERRGEAVEIVRLVSLEALLFDFTAEQNEDLTLLKGLADPAPGPEALCLAALDRDAVRSAVARLPARERRVIEAHYHEETIFREIAPRLGVGESRAAQLHAQALERLQLAPEFEEERETMIETAGSNGTKPPVSWEPWTEAEEKRLSELYGSVTAREIAQQIGRTEAAVDLRIRNMKAAGRLQVPARPFDWSEAQDAELLALLAAGLSKPQIAARLGRSLFTIRRRLAKLAETAPPTREPAAVEELDEEPEEEPWSARAPVVVRAQPAPLAGEPVPEQTAVSELLILAEVAERLEALEPRARTRAVRWLSDRFGGWK